MNTVRKRVPRFARFTDLFRIKIFSGRPKILLKIEGLERDSFFL